MHNESQSLHRMTKPTWMQSTMRFVFVSPFFCCFFAKTECTRKVCVFITSKKSTLGEKGKWPKNVAVILLVNIANDKRMKLNRYFHTIVFLRIALDLQSNSDLCKNAQVSFFQRHSANYRSLWPLCIIISTKHKRRPFNPLYVKPVHKLRARCIHTAVEWMDNEWNEYFFAVEKTASAESTSTTNNQKNCYNKSNKWNDRFMNRSSCTTKNTKTHTAKRITTT